jgi:hypothetical protein
VHCITSFILGRGGHPAKRGATTAAGITVHSFVIRYQSAGYKVSGIGVAERRYDDMWINSESEPVRCVIVSFYGTDVLK